MAKPLYCGASNIMQAFDSLRPDNAYFSVWQGNKMLYQYNGESLDAGREILDQMMTAAESNFNTDVFDIKFHSKLDDGYITNKSKVIGTMPVRAYDPSADGVEPGITGITRPGDLPKPVYNMLQKIEEHLTMEDRLKALETAQPAVRELDWFDRISGLLEKPGMVETVGSLLAPILQKLVPGTAVNVNIPVNGATVKASQKATPAELNPVQPDSPGHNDDHEDFTPEESLILDNAISDLSAYCDVVDVLPKLVLFAERERPMFDFMLQKLKTDYNGKEEEK